MNDLKNLFEGFTIHLEAAGRRPTTVTWYAKHVNRFMNWLNQEQGLTTVSDIAPLHIRRFIAYQQNDVRAWESNPHVPTQDHGLSSTYIAGSVRALRGWFNWMEDEEYIDKNPMRKVKTPKEYQRLIEPLEAEEIKRLLKAIDGTTVAAYRNRAIILTLLDCGLRVSELCALDIDDVDLRSGWLRVREGKGWKERKVPVGGTLRRALWQYSTVRPNPLGGNQRFFLTEQGWPLPTGRVRKVLLHFGHKAKVSDIHPHRFRHTFALQFLRNGGDSFTSKMLMGHTTLEMVNRYVRLAAVDLKSIHAKASPADHLRL